MPSKILEAVYRGRQEELTAFKNDLARAELLLAHGADPAVRTNEGETAEAIATRHGHAHLARRLRGEMP